METVLDTSTLAISEKIANLSMSLKISSLCELTLEQALKDARVNGYSSEILKNMATSLGLVKSQSRESLVKSIRSHQAQSKQLQKITPAGDSDNEDNNEDENENDEELEGNADETISAYRKNKHTFPRLCNILLQYPDVIFYQFYVRMEQFMESFWQDLLTQKHLGPVLTMRRQLTNYLNQSELAMKRLWSNLKLLVIIQTRISLIFARMMSMFYICTCQFAVWAILR
jgi:hypothetical protein